MEKKNAIANIRNTIKATHSARSAWDRGLALYIDELLDNVACGYGPDEVPTEKLLLNGAHDWTEFSWGGSSLAYNTAIALRLCNKTELKRTDFGKRRPNSREDWLDVQARALYQAARLILQAASYLDY